MDGGGRIRDEQYIGEERATAAFGPRFYFHLFIQVERIEVRMLTKQTNL